MEDIVVEFFAHHYAENPNDKEIVDDDFDVEAEIRRADEEAEAEAAADREREKLPDDFVEEV